MMLNHLKLRFDYIYQFIQLLIKRWSNYIGLANRQSFEDEFYQLLHDKNYDEALKLAQQYDFLDTDLVYKCKWRSSSITVQSINLVMNMIQDKLWVINECVQTVPVSYEACRRLIDFGLEEANLRLLYELGYDEVQQDGKSATTKKPLLGDMPDEAIMGLIDFNNLNDQQKELSRCRQRLLTYQHSLIAYENILGDRRTVQRNFDHVFYDEFRNKCPLNNCIDYAHDGDSHAVETCLNFYTNELSAHILAILSNFPETVSPYQYRNLLPCIRDGEQTFEWRPINKKRDKLEPDWSSGEICVLEKEKAELYEKELYETNAHLRKYLNESLTSELLSQWFIERALEIESRCLLLSNAIQLLHLGSELRIRNLKPTHDKLVEFAGLVYEHYSDKIVHLSYSEFIRMKDPTRYLLVTSESLKHETRYKLVALSLALCDLDEKMIAKLLNYVIELRKRDEKIQRAYLMQNM